MNGTVFNIQRFSTHDGPGIRTTVFLKGCPLRCFWCQNPESQPVKPVLMVNTNECTGCGRCVETCSAHAVTIVNGTAIVDRDRCLACGVCVDRCFNSVRSVAGHEMSTEEVMKTVLRDRAMYHNSGGGITISGGELTMQWQFALELLKQAKANGLDTAIETCGFCRWEILDQLLDYTDHVMYDIKCVDAEKHLRGTGVSNELILQNAVRVASKAKDVLFRMPLIPNYNDTAEYVTSVAEFVRDQAGLDAAHIELLQYNNLGEDKFDRMGRKDEMPRLKKQSEEYMEELRSCVTHVFDRYA